MAPVVIDDELPFVAGPYFETFVSGMIFDSSRRNGGSRLTAICYVEMAGEDAAKLQPFFNDDPEWWFRQAEVKFVISGIKSSQTKACYVSASLDAATNLLVADIDLDGADPYKE